MKLTIGSRGSALALWQAHWIKGQLEALGHVCYIEIIKTTGDKITDVPLAKVGTKGLFTKEIEEALLAGTVDVAVHSLKDLPTELPPGLGLAAVPVREDPRDVLVGRTLDNLGPGSRVGTSSLRREAQLRARFPELLVEPLRGNVDTRLRKLREGRYDAIVLAAAGLKRLGLEEHISEFLSPEQMCPAVGQGALAIETRCDGGEAEAVCGGLDHPATRTAVLAERAVLSRLGGGCQVPIGAHARVNGTTIQITGVVVSPDGSQIIRREAQGGVEEAEALGYRLAGQLLDGGGNEVLQQVYGTSPTIEPEP
jgi:hydroxymethylbilane synthase